jgi:hypothetical protein
MRNRYWQTRSKANIKHGILLLMLDHNTINKSKR